CTCGHQNSDIGNFCVACGMTKTAATAAQLSDDTVWFYYRGSQRVGPTSTREIAKLLHANMLDRNTPVWKSGMNDWAPLHQTALGALASQRIPAAPLQTVSDIYAWMIALLPMTVGVILSVLKVTSLGVFLAVSSLTIIFEVLDLREIKKATGRLESWVWFILLLTPVYLFIRAGKAGQRYGYAIAWCVLYFCTMMFSTIQAYLELGLL
ncbi:MAG TPA: DUF4339 domain-containing protein, partial [Clostridia bacterium]|nr:DUF4339 domain-containing protein [Clostridia bacterium]